MLKSGFNKTTQSNEEAKTMFGKDAEVTTGQATLNSMLGQGCKIKGDIELQGTIRIDGQFEGSISCPDTLIIGKSGIVKAEVKVKNAVIGGKLIGNIAAANKIELSLYAPQAMIPKTVAALDAGNVPDVAYGDVYDFQVTAKWAYDGKLEDLTSILDPMRAKF